MTNNIDELLKTALAPSAVPDERLNNQVLSAVKERKNMTNNMTNRRKMPVAAIIALCILIFGSLTALAARHYLTPSEIATEMKDDTLKAAFLSENALFINEAQEIGDYRIILLGTVAGKNISDYLASDYNSIVADDRIYTVVAIEHTDGTPIPDISSDEYDMGDFYVSHYIRGLNPKKYSLMSMGGSSSAVVRDGVEYRIMEMDNIEMFADKGIYVGISSGTFYDENAYIYDENTGIMTRNADYDGVNALFELPIDKAKADPVSAKAYLEELEKSWNTPDEPIEKDETDITVDNFIQNLTAENIDEYAAPVESTRMICTPDADGMVYYEYELETGAAGNGTVSIKDLFPDGATGELIISGYSYSENGLTDLAIDTYMLNEDGTVTFVVYKPIT
ncbi:MAG: hypothetical protein HDR03_00740 [Lachnospiraceae bacterium]|nr:hypothetical protein [Lachnospiraceae bacterium]